MNSDVLFADEYPGLLLTSLLVCSPPGCVHSDVIRARSPRFSLVSMRMPAGDKTSVNTLLPDSAPANCKVAV